MTIKIHIYIVATLFLTSGFCKNIRKPSIGSRIVGGEPTTIEQYPYQVSLIYIDSHYCGGSIIDNLHVLTAAHCTDGYQQSLIFIRAGSTYVNEGGDLKSVAKIDQHPNYDKDSYDYDISVITLTEALTYSSKVQAIALASSGEAISAGLYGTATGWGRLYENGPLPMELQKVDLPTIATDVCQMVYGNSFTERMMCAGFAAGKQDTCQGDSGGPYAYNNTLWGVTSWGDGCGAMNSPGVYAKVPFFRDYIDAIIKS